MPISKHSLQPIPPGKAGMIVIENGVAVEAVTKQPIAVEPSLGARAVSLPRPHNDSNPLWLGPCADGPLGGITQSMLVRFLSCRERFRLRYVVGLEPHPKWNHRVGYGNMWHVCEEELARHGDDHGLASMWRQRLVEHTQDMCEKHPLQRDEIAKWYCVCKVQFPEYVKYWSDHPDVVNRTPLMQEQVFDVPYAMPSGRTVRLRGKFDSVDFIDAECTCGTDRTGPSAEAHDATCPAAGGAQTGIYLFETKTRGDIDQLQIERQLKFDLQTMTYLVALGSNKDGFLDDAYRDGDLDWNKQYPICGARFNVVRRPLSGGVGNIRPHAAKATKTKMTPAETDEEFYERLRRDYIASDPGYWFFRVRAEVSDRDVQVFRDTCLDPLLEQLCWWYDAVTGINTHSEYYNYPHKKTLNYRTPFGVWSALEESGATEYDSYLETGSEAGLRRVGSLFTELQ